MAVTNRAITIPVRMKRFFTLSSEHFIHERLPVPTHLATFCLTGKCCIFRADFNSKLAARQGSECYGDVSPGGELGNGRTDRHLLLVRVGWMLWIVKASGNYGETIESILPAATRANWNSMHSRTLARARMQRPAPGASHRVTYLGRGYPSPKSETCPSHNWPGDRGYDYRTR
jgi:hypothetical protein